MIEHIDTIVIAAIFLALHVALIVYIILNMYNRRKGERELYADIHRQNTNI
jgi:heme/copper-type cytochrome/quinol oxidase subunit 2